MLEPFLPVRMVSPIVEAEAKAERSTVRRFVKALESIQSEEVDWIDDAPGTVPTVLLRVYPPGIVETPLPKTVEMPALPAKEPKASVEGPLSLRNSIFLIFPKTESERA